MIEQERDPKEWRGCLADIREAENIYPDRDMYYSLEEKLYVNEERHFESL